MTKRSLDIIKKMKEVKKSDIVFCSEKGTHVTPKNYERTFQKVIKKSGIETCNSHTLRHTYATRLFEQNVSVKIVSELLGHSKVSHTLDIYTHVMPEIKYLAVQALDDLYSNIHQPNTTHITTQLQ